MNRKAETRLHTDPLRDTPAERPTPGLRLAYWLMDQAAKIDRRKLWSVARLLGWLWYRLDRSHRKVVLDNLERAFGDELDPARLRTISEKTFAHLARVFLEVAILRILEPQNLDAFITFAGLEHLEAARRKGKGVLVLASHFGNWEMMSVAFSLRYFPFHVVVRPLDNPFLDRLIEGLRTRGGNRVIPKKSSAPQILRLLRRGEIVALLMDQNVDWYEGVFVPFFKDTACTNKGLAVLALRTGVPVVSVYNFRQPDGRYCMVFEPEIPIVRTGSQWGDIEENTARFNRAIERYVREDPEQWFWVHQRWKTPASQPWPRMAKKKKRGRSAAHATTAL